MSDEVEPGFEVLTVDELEAMSKSMRRYSESLEQLAALVVNEERAHLVRLWRVTHDYTWRAVAEAAFKAWGGAEFPEWDPPSNQLMGMALCERAAELLGEDPGAEPWN